MTWAPDYCTVAQLEDWMVRDQAFNTEDLAQAAIAITSASRAIDLWCNRQFGVTTSQPRFYDGESAIFLDCGRAIPVDDLMTAPTVVTDIANDGLYSTSMTLGTDYELWPYNAASENRPWTHLVLSPRATTYFPWTRRAIRVTGLFGWSSVPAAVTQACLIQASRFMVRRDSAFGVAGSPDLGNELRLQAGLDVDVQTALQAYKRQWGAA